MGRPKKTSGMHCCIPERSFQDCYRSNLSLLLFGFLFSCHYFLLSISLSFRASESGGARFQYSSIEFARNLVKRKVSVVKKKSKIKN
jgi:hypothetical protein